MNEILLILISKNFFWKLYVLFNTSAAGDKMKHACGGDTILYKDTTQQSYYEIIVKLMCDVYTDVTGQTEIRWLLWTAKT